MSAAACWHLAAAAAAAPPGGCWAASASPKRPASLEPVQLHRKLVLRSQQTWPARGDVALQPAGEFLLRAPSTARCIAAAAVLGTSGTWRAKQSCSLRSAAAGGLLSGSWWASRQLRKRRKRLSAIAARAVASAFRALTKIYLRQEPDINSPRTGAAVEAGQVFHVEAVVPPPSPGEQGYFLVAECPGWVFDTGIAGDWAGRQIIERLEDSEATMTEEEKAHQEAKAEEKAAEAEEEAKAPCGPSELSVLQLLSWAKTQPAMKVHPGVSVQESSLVVSMAISKGTPLVGAMSAVALFEELQGDHDVVDAEHLELLQAASSAAPEVRSLRLGLRLLNEGGRGTSRLSKYWQSLPPVPASPVLWRADQVRELQHVPVRKAAQAEADAVRAFAEKNLARAPLGASLPNPQESLSWACAVAAERAVELDDGSWALVPLVDLVGPPVGVQALKDKPAELQTPTCFLTVDGSDDNRVFILSAARDLQPGDVLTRDVGLSGDALFLRWGLTAPGRDGDRLPVTACIMESQARSWQRKALQRAMSVLPGRMPGDIQISGEIRRCQELNEAISETLFTAARVLLCTSEDELEVYVGDVENASAEAGDSSGLIGLFGDMRTACIDKLVSLLRGVRGDFATTIQEDTRAVETLSGTKQLAAAFRLEKKRILEDVLALLEEAKADDPGGSGALPFAVTGGKP